MSELAPEAATPSAPRPAGGVADPVPPSNIGRGIVRPIREVMSELTPEAAIHAAAVPLPGSMKESRRKRQKTRV